MTDAKQTLAGAVAELLEDKDPVTVKALDAYLRTHFMDMEKEFHSLFESCDSETEAKRIFDAIHKYTAEAMLEELAQAVTLPERDSLREWFIVSRMILPTAKYEPMLAKILSVAHTIEQEQGRFRTFRGKANAVIRIFYRDLIRRRMRDEDVPLAALLPTEVLEIREGIPIVVDILFVILLEMLGYEVKVYMLDDAFLPCITENAKSYVFVMEDASVVTLESVKDRIREDKCSEGSLPLLELLTSVMSDIFRISGETDRSEYMSRAHAIMQSER